MNYLMIGLLAAVLILLAVLLIQQGKLRDPSVAREIDELKDQLVDMKTRQLQAQNESLLKQGEQFTQTQKLLSEQLGAIMNSVSESLTKTQGNITAQLGQTGTVVQEIQKKLGVLEESTRQMKEIGRDISSLQDILRAPKLRGNLGEYLLEDLLRQILPMHNFEIQYRFASGTQVDAVIKLGQGLVPVDAKFPLESFQRLITADSDDEKKAARREFIRSVKLRIDEIADKYIRPDEGTFDFALIYIPAENVFYETIVSDSLGGREFEIFNYALQKRVIPVSPNSFYAYLTAIVFGLRGFKIEQRAREILSQLSAIQDGFAKFHTDLQLVYKHLGNATLKFEECLKRGERFQDKLGQVTGIQSDTQAPLLPGIDKNI